MEYIITFNSTNNAIKAEQCLLTKKIPVGVLPLPTQLSAGCGICLRINIEDAKQVLRILNDNNINEIGLYTRVKENDGFIYTKEQVQI